MRHLSNTYPDFWTEERRKADEAALTPDQNKQLRQEWETPPDFWQALNSVFDFEIDVCASEHNSKCPRLISSAVDSLRDDVPWCGFGANRAWCNPGFSDVLPWHQKAFSEAQDSAAALVVVIGIPGASQAWYEYAQQHADEIVDLSPRVHFLAPWPLKQSSNNRESQLFIYRRKLVANRPATRTLWNWKES
jgi:phage N-6-adenine-methyltransferase